MTGSILRYTGLILALLWGMLWSAFGLLSAFSEGFGLASIFLHVAAPGLVFLASALIAWKWESYGSKLLIAEGLAVLLAYPLAFHRFPLSTILFVLLTMALPPLVAGVLLFLNSRAVRLRETSA